MRHTSVSKPVALSAVVVLSAAKDLHLRVVLSVAKDLHVLLLPFLLLSVAPVIPASRSITPLSSE